MASGKHATSGPAIFALDDTTTAEPYRDSEEHEGLMDYSDFPAKRRPLIDSILHVLGMSPRRRRGGYEYEATSTEDRAEALPQTRERSMTRRCRRSCMGAWAKRLLVGVPVVVLMLFGILHILQVSMTKARLFWDDSATDEWFPDWAKPGHAGEGLASYPTDATRDVLPISCHSHNDYWRHIPLFDAIHWGCTGVEADVWLFDNELYVGHNLAALTRNRTFRSLYVDPLVQLLDKMNPNTDFVNATGHGIFDVDPSQTLVLLVDFKTNGRDLFPVVSSQLSALREKGYLTYWDGERVHSRAITVVGTGNTPFDMVVENSTYRDIFFDAPLDQMWEAEDGTSSSSTRPNPVSPNGSKASSQGNIGIDKVKEDFSTSNSYYASVSFTKAIGLVWRSRLSKHQLNIIRGQIRGAHSKGLKVRYWETPAWPIALRNHIWSVLVREGADMLNVDDLRGAAVEDWRRRTKHGLW